MTSTKFQISSKLQNSKIQTKSFRNFEIGAWDLFGIWNLEFAEYTMKINRRDFLKMGGGAGVAIAIGGGFWKWSQFPVAENPSAPGVEGWIPTICGQCMGGCGILVRVIDGWAVNIAGNPLHPVNRGTLCPKGIAGLQGLYDPDRIRTPLKRIGKRGEGQWQAISWEEALQIQALSAYGQFRRGNPERRGKLVQIEPRLSVTGIKADEWLPIQPGTEGLLALGIANMMIKEGLYNKEFVANLTFGFENWTDANGKEHLGFKEFVLSEYSSDVVSRRTGVPIDSIIRLAREFASNQPSLAIGFRDRPFHQMAVSILNGLVGNIDASGGVLAPRTAPLQPLPNFKKDSIAQKGINMERVDEGRNLPMTMHQAYLFANNVIAGKPYRPKVLFLYYTNPLFSNPHPDLFAKAFDQIPLIVSFSPYMDDTTSFADLILPDRTPLERWQDDPVFLNNGFPVLGIRQPVIEPLFQTKATGDVLLHLAKSLGGEVQKAFPWKDFKEVLLHGIKGIFDAKRGDTFGLQFEQAWTRLLERGGWAAPSYGTFEEFWKQLQEKGGWWDPIYDFKEWDRVFRTPTKKFEFYAQALRQIHPTFTSNDLKDLSFFPHWEEWKKAGDEKEYPLHLDVFRTMTLTGSRNANQPWLQASVGSYVSERWETWVEINPETAKRLGIGDRDWVWVESPKGKVKARAKLYQGAMPDVVSIPIGEGHRSGGRWSKDLGENPYRLIGGDLDPLTGYPINESTRVKIYKA